MAKNDFHVIAAVILTYLYACLKEGREVNVEYIDHAHMDIPKSYWDFILTELYQCGYVKGCIPYASKDGRGILLTSDFSITMKGIQYLQSDSMIEKTKKFLSEAKGWPEAIAALLDITYTVF